MKTCVCAAAGFLLAGLARPANSITEQVMTASKPRANPIATDVIEPWNGRGCAVESKTIPGIVYNRWPPQLISDVYLLQ